MDQKAQISAEFVLVIGFVLVMVLVFGYYIGEQNELNTITAAARSGATEAVSDISFLNRSVQPVRVNEVTMNTSVDPFLIQIRLSGNLSSYNNNIINRTTDSISSLGYEKVSYDTIHTARHNYRVVIV